MRNTAKKMQLEFGEVEGEKIYTVADLTRLIKGDLEAQFTSIWVQGEISGFKHHHSGHMYFSLKDEQSILKAVCFARSNQGIKFEMEDGLSVLCFGRVSVYEARGEYQLYVDRVEPKGLGALQLAFEQLKKKLQAEGLFDEERKQEIPFFPTRVGVVTSPTGAAIRDILNVINRRSGASVLVRPVTVQGEGSAKEIAQGIKDLNEYGELDVMIVGRGGGSMKDLWAFNEEPVVRAIAASRIPVISAVGHEVDWTLADLVADLRAPTPSAAAELVTAHQAELGRNVTQLVSRLHLSMRRELESRVEILRALMESRTFTEPMTLIDDRAQRLDDLSRRMVNCTRSALTLRKSQFGALTGKLEALSPLAILSRGYSVVFDEVGGLLRSVKSLSVGDETETKMLDGSYVAKVLSVREEKKDGN